MALHEEGTIRIHTENIFPIIKKAVYSDHEIFLRELVSNSVDAISKRRMASFAGECQDSDKGKIKISINKENKTVTISDNGIGMSVEEIKKYINQVAFSSAEDFLEKYKKNEDGIIGHFGLGFYSSFMVSKNVEIVTKSAIDSSIATKWSCDGSPKFILEEANREDIGTDVILYLLDEELEYLEDARIKSLIKKYCDFMPVEIYLDEEIINKMNPPWRQKAKELSDKDYIELYKYLYPFQGEPLLWIHLDTDYPYNLQGILYFPKISGRADWENGEIKLYSNQVFVSDSIKEVVPRYLLPLRGVLDSSDIPLNVSRSALQTDRRVRSIGNFVAKKVSAKLKDIMQQKPDFYSEIWESISPFIKIGAMEDDKFSAQVEDIIIFPTTTTIEEIEGKDDYIKGNDKVYTTIKSYIKRLNDINSKKILYCTDEISQFNALNLWKAKGIEVIKAESVIDTQFIPWLESKNEDMNFQRVDSEISSSSENNNEIIDKDGESNSEKIKEIVKSALNNEKITIQVESLKGDKLPPAIILLPEQMRRINDMGALMEQTIPGLPEYHVLLVNKEHTLINGLLKLKDSAVIVSSNENSPNNALSVEIVKHIYDMARLSTGGLEPAEMTEFQGQNAELMGKLLDKAL